MTAAQKLAKEKFKKAIAIRSKTGVSLKEAFAQVYGKKKVGAVKKKTAKKKVVKKAAPKKVVKKAAPKKAVKKVIQKSKPRYSAKQHKNWGIIPEHRRRVNGLPNVIGALSSHTIKKIDEANKVLVNYEKILLQHIDMEKRSPKGTLKRMLIKEIKEIKELIKEQKTHIAQLKKHI